jgi:hypothetical protein
MPSGPEHYKAAEHLLSQASFVASPDDPQPITPTGHEMRHDVHHGLVARAQVHATLAQAAAIALSCPVDDQPPEDAKQWHKVAGSKPSTPPEDVVEAEIVEDDYGPF